MVCLLGNRVGGLFVFLGAALPCSAEDRPTVSASPFGYESGGMVAREVGPADDHASCPLLPFGV